LSRFARRLSHSWRQLSLPFDERIVVAVSGGADSTALLLAFDELIKAGRMALTLKVAHLDHGLRGEAGAIDARFVEDLAGALGYEVVVGRGEVARRARATRDNLEQAARRERYEFLGRTARECGARAVAAAHTVEDQAETLLLALLRGSGARGLGGMRSRRSFDERGDDLLLVRPLLGAVRRAETAEYCAARGVRVRADEMNEDEQFARVRVRRQLLPLLQTFNPRAVETLARTAGLLRAEADALEQLGEELLIEARRAALLQTGATRAGINARRPRAANENETVADEPAAVVDETAAVADETAAVEREVAAFEDEAGAVVGEPDGVVASPALSIEVLRGAGGAVLSYALRGWIKSERGNLRRIEATHIEAVAGLLKGVHGGRVAELPGGASVERRRGLLMFRAGAGGGEKS